MGQRREAPRALTQGPEWRGRREAAPLGSHSGAKAINPGSARAAPSHPECLLPHWPAAIETSLPDESSAGASGSVADAIEQFKAGKLAAVTAADVAGPWT